MTEETRLVKGVPVTTGDWYIDKEVSPKVKLLLERRIPRRHLEGSKVLISGGELSKLKEMGVSRGIASYEDLESTPYSEKGTIYIQSDRDVYHEVGHHVFTTYLTGKQVRRVATLCGRARRRGDLLGYESCEDPSEFFASAYANYMYMKYPEGSGRDASYYRHILSTSFKGMTKLLDEVFSRRRRR